jgi:hypothetical protein
MFISNIINSRYGVLKLKHMDGQVDIISPLRYITAHYTGKQQHFCGPKTFTMKGIFFITTCLEKGDDHSGRPV